MKYFAVLLSKVLATVALLAVVIEAVWGVTKLLNQPDDMAVIGGALLAATVLLTIPLCGYLIWKKEIRETINRLFPTDA
jgi:hypothetical protein